LLIRAQCSAPGFAANTRTSLVPDVSFWMPAHTAFAVDGLVGPLFGSGEMEAKHDELGRR
jgi:hypothetical protein